ncbi:MAG: NUDIX hydrolase [Lachnospira sp.]|nr:NUDIX hydrolase [Lachnospira sp.]
MTYVCSKEEKEYLARYDISAYERPSLATDIVVFSILNDGVSDNIRKLQKKSLKVLLIKRASYPYKDCWALPGGFLRPGEDVIANATRELFEETGVSDAYLQLVGTYGEKGRDPRGWIVSNTFMALVDGNKCTPRAGTDAWEARWFSVELIKGDAENSSTVNYTLRFINEETGQELVAELQEHKVYRNFHRTVSYEIVSGGGIAFDHAKIVLNALLSLRENVENNLKVAFNLMPEMFTLTELQNAFEIILDKKLLTANFRRKIADYVDETDKIIEGAGHRPAKLFKRKIEVFYD